MYVCICVISLFQHSDDLLFALRMLSLGLGAWQIIDSQVFTEPKLVSVGCRHCSVPLLGLLSYIMWSITVGQFSSFYFSMSSIGIVELCDYACA